MQKSLNKEIRKLYEIENRLISRRGFLKQSLFNAGALLLGGTTVLSQGPRGSDNKGTTQPNILLFFTDQERPASRYLPELNLPNRKRILNNCVEFTNCYCAYPLCSPSRSSLLTGLYPHDTGITNNLNKSGDRSLPTSIPNLASEFSKAGYDVGYFGKWHLNDPATRPDLRAYGFSKYYIPQNFNDGKNYDPFTADKAASWIRRRGRNPWLCIVSIINPHDVYYPQKYLKIPNRPTRLPPNFNDDLSGITRPAELKAIVDAEANGYRKWTPSQWRFRLGFYAYLIELTDIQLGTVLDAVDKKNQADNTIVIYTSDHGEQHASHQLRGKCFMYEESTRIPLIISSKSLYSKYNQSNLLASNIDVVPTLCDMANITWPTPLTGRSLIDPFNDDSAPIFCETAFYEYGITDLTYMVRTKNWKYVRYHPSGDEQLFNLIEDLPEINNLAYDPSHRAEKKRHVTHLNDWLKKGAS